MQSTTKYPAPEHVIFTEQSATGLVGQTPTMRSGEETEQATIVGAKVVDEGKAIEVTFEVADDGPLARKLRDANPYLFSPEP